jgi:hypothetical protein
MSGVRILGMRHKAIDTRRAAFETSTPRLCDKSAKRRRNRLQRRQHKPTEKMRFS